MDDRVAEIREALAAWDAIPAVDVPSEAQTYAAVFDAARDLLDLLGSDALIIRRDENGEWPQDQVNLAVIGLQQVFGHDLHPMNRGSIVRTVLDALTSSQGVEP